MKDGFITMTRSHLLDEASTHPGSTQILNTNTNPSTAVAPVPTYPTVPQLIIAFLNIVVWAYAAYKLYARFSEIRFLAAQQKAQREYAEQVEKREREMQGLRRRLAFVREEGIDPEYEVLRARFGGGEA